MLLVRQQQVAEVVICLESIELRIGCRNLNARIVAINLYDALFNLGHAPWIDVNKRRSFIDEVVLIVLDTYLGNFLIFFCVKLVVNEHATIVDIRYKELRLSIERKLWYGCRIFDGLVIQSPLGAITGYYGVCLSIQHILQILAFFVFEFLQVFIFYDGVANLPEWAYHDKVSEYVQREL